MLGYPDEGIEHVVLMGLFPNRYFVWVPIMPASMLPIHSSRPLYRIALDANVEHLSRAADSWVMKPRLLVNAAFGHTG